MERESATAVWSTCAQYPQDECLSTADFPRTYMKCAAIPYEQCSTRSACVSTGTCSDRDQLRNIISDDEGNAVIRYGVCANSGWYKEFLPGIKPWCTQQDYYMPIGCKDGGYINSPEECEEFRFSQAGYWLWQEWAEPATTEDECRNFGRTRYGCILPGDEEVRELWWMDEETCTCQGGFNDFAWTWQPGVWTGGQARALQWRKKEYLPYVQYWNDAISFQKLESWAKESVNTKFLNAVKSESICTNNFVSAQLTAVVCDCLAADAPKNSSCYDTNSEESSIAIILGVQDICEGEVSVLKGPSSVLTSYPDSVADDCTNVYLYVLERAWFAAPKSSGTVSFTFQTINADESVVRNKGGAVVGQLVGDGSELVFEIPAVMKYFELCLRVSDPGDEDRFPVPDFGYTTDDYDSIYPIGASVHVREVLTSIFYCSNLTYADLPKNEAGNIVRMFPVVTLENEERATSEVFSDQTKGMVYSLAAFYLIDLLLLALFCIILARELSQTKKSVPVVAWIAVIFLILCIFRIVFLFLYIQEKLVDDPLTEYVLFEIPTFLLFTVVILANGFWRKLSQKSAFFFHQTDKQLWAIVFFAIFLIWCLFIIVTVIYSEDILANGTTESDCPGRVAADTQKLEDDTRQLSIIYQSIVIVVTFLLGCIFWYSSYRLFKITSKGVSRAKQFIFRIGALIVSAFMVRCVLFIIILGTEYTAWLTWVTLLLTECLMIFLVQLEFNKNFYHSVLGSTMSRFMPSGMNLTGTRGSSDSRMTEGSSTGSGSHVSSKMDD